jgi:NhaP-type Na+/H+ or K+/H+ antiporter
MTRIDPTQARDQSHSRTSVARSVEHAGRWYSTATGSWPPSLRGSSSARRRGVYPPTPLHLVEDAGSLLSLAVWFTLGQVVNQAVDAGIGVDIVVYALVALTVGRVVPVALSLVASGVDRVDALFLGWLGPRGLASIVFGMLAFLDLSAPDGALVIKVMVVTGLLSVVLHGLSSGPIGAAYARRAAKRRSVAADEEARAPALSERR